MFSLSLTVCGEETESPVNDVTADTVVSSEGTLSTVDDSESKSATTSKVSNDDEWREFLADYEDWVDDYIVLLEKYEANPTDMSILTEYTEMAAEVSEWANKADEIEESLDAEDLAEYTSTLTRIIEKLNNSLA